MAVRVPATNEAAGTCPAASLTFRRTADARPARARLHAVAKVAPRPSYTSQKQQKSRFWVGVPHGVQVRSSRGGAEALPDNAGSPTLEMRLPQSPLSGPGIANPLLFQLRWGRCAKVRPLLIDDPPPLLLFTFIIIFRNNVVGSHFLQIVKVL